MTAAWTVGTDEGGGLVEDGRRGPGEVATDLLVAHGVEEPRRVALVEGFERDVATSERDGVGLHPAESAVRPRPSAKGHPGSGDGTTTGRAPAWLTQ